MSNDPKVDALVKYFSRGRWVYFVVTILVSVGFTIGYWAFR
jgi:hypothetical protein